MVGLLCCLWALSSCSERGYSLSRSTGSRCFGFGNYASWALEPGFSSCGAWGYLLHTVCYPPRPEIEPVSPALQGRFLTTGHEGSPTFVFKEVSSRTGRWEEPRIVGQAWELFLQWILIIHLSEKLIQTFIILPNLSVTNERWPCLDNCRRAKFGTHAVHSKPQAVRLLMCTFLQPDMEIFAYAN